MTANARTPPITSANTKAGTEDGAIPAKVLENIRPTAIAGLAKLVELVKKYAAPMYAPTAAGVLSLRSVRASAKMSTSNPTVATTSDSAWAVVALSCVEIETAALEN